MAIKYCDFLGGNDETGDGSSSNPYKTITVAVTGLSGSNEVRCAKSPDPTLLSGNLSFVFNSNAINTSEDLTEEISQGDFIGKGSDELWYEIDSITSSTITLKYKYAGSTEETSGYVLNITDTGSAGGATTVIQSIPITAKGTGFSALITVSGGWDLTTETQTGWTNFVQTGANRYGYGLYHISSDTDADKPSYIKLSKLRFCRYNYGIYFRNPTYIIFEDITLLGNNYGYLTERYFIKYSFIERLNAIGNLNDGFQSLRDSTANVFLDCNFLSNAKNGFFINGVNFYYNLLQNCNAFCNTEVGLRFLGGTISSSCFKNCKSNYNTQYGLYIEKYTNNALSFINVECQYNGIDGININTILSGFFKNVQCNNNTGSGMYLRQSTFEMENISCTDNGTYGIQLYANNSSYGISLKNIILNNNGIRDFWGSNNFRRPTSLTTPVNVYGSSEFTRTGLNNLLFENFQANSVLFDWATVDGGSGDYSLQGLTNFLITASGIVTKHTGIESRDGEGSCIKFIPRWSEPYILEPRAHLYRQVPLFTDFQFLFTSDNVNKKVSIFIKKTDEFNGEIRIGCLGNFNYYTEQICEDVSDTYAQYSIIIPAENVICNSFYRFFISVIADSASLNTGIVYADDFIIEDIES